MQFLRHQNGIKVKTGMSGIKNIMKNLSIFYMLKENLNASFVGKILKVHSHRVNFVLTNVNQLQGGHLE